MLTAPSAVTVATFAIHETPREAFRVSLHESSKKKKDERINFRNFLRDNFFFRKFFFVKKRPKNFYKLLGILKKKRVCNKSEFKRWHLFFGLSRVQVIKKFNYYVSKCTAYYHNFHLIKLEANWSIYAGFFLMIPRIPKLCEFYN